MRISDWSSDVCSSDLARDHHAVAHLDDLLEPVDRGGLLDLGEQRRLALDQPPRLGEILGPLDERERDPVDPLIDREGEVAAVLVGQRRHRHDDVRSEEHTSELQSLMRTSYAVFCLKKKTKKVKHKKQTQDNHT